MAAIREAKCEIELSSNMKLNYKFYLALAIICFIVFIILTRRGVEFRYAFLGLGIGAGLRSLYEFFKKAKQNP
jgi:uncharacterized integral membrane protein